MTQQLMHDVRVSYVNTDDDNQALQNCFNHSFALNNPGSFTSGSLTLLGTQTHSVDNVNYLYVTGNKPFRVVINGNNEFVGNHFSLINIDNDFDILFENFECEEGEIRTDLKYLYGKLTAPIT